MSTKRPGDCPCPCRECVSRGSHELLSRYKRQKHVALFGLASETYFIPLRPEHEESDLSGTPGQESDEDMCPPIENNKLDLGTALSSWFCQNRGLSLTRQRMDDLLGLLRNSDWSHQLPRQIRTLENQRNRIEPLGDAFAGLTRTAVCGNCLLSELIQPKSECMFIMSMVTF